MTSKVNKRIAIREFLVELEKFVSKNFDNIEILYTYLFLKGEINIKGIHIKKNPKIRLPSLLEKFNGYRPEHGKNSKHFLDRLICISKRKELYLLKYCYSLEWIELKKDISYENVFLKLSGMELVDEEVKVKLEIPTTYSSYEEEDMWKIKIKEENKKNRKIRLIPKDYTFFEKDFEI